MSTNAVANSTITESAPPLTAKMAPWVHQLLEQPVMLQSWLQQHGSPLHVINGSEFRRNVSDLLGVFKTRGLAGGLYFARKANKLPWFVSLAREQGIGVDTASLEELKETLALGLSPDKIVVTALGKDRALVDLAISHGCLIILDNNDEFALLQESSSAVGKPARIGLRFAGFVVGGRKVFSRFGFPMADAPEIISKVLASSSWLKLECLHAHLDRYDTVERATAARSLIELVDYSASKGGRITAIDLGGGILMRYLEHKTQWKTFVAALTDSVQGKRPHFTYRHDGLGYHRAGDTIVGTADLYPAWNALSKERFLAAILDHEQDGTPLYKELSQRGLKLFFEPGRALLDNTGVTLAKVVFRKRDTDGNLLVGVAMNRTNLRPFRAEFCSDPIVLSDGPREQLSEGAYLVGCLCGESDIIFKRKLTLTFLPEIGDVIAFINSAGYLAHHMEIGTHGNPLPKNVLYDAASKKITSVFPEQ